MGKLTQLALCMMLAAVAAGDARAQSAESFENSKIAPATAEKTSKSGKPAAVQPGPVSTTPSRFIGAAEKDGYLASQSAAFLIVRRERDPFGQAQDPDAKPIIKASAPKAVKRAAPAQATPFADIVRLVVINAIMPAEQRFMIGARSVKVGEQLVLSLRGRHMRVLITSVTAREIGFKNLDNGETAKRQLDLLPAGMTPGLGGITAPGMVSDRGNAPIELESNEPSPDTQPKSTTEP